MRSVHQKCIGRRKGAPRMHPRSSAFLDGYYCCTCDYPSLEEMKELAKFIGVKKETVYWWFVNRRKKDKKKCQATQS